MSLVVPAVLPSSRKDLEEKLTLFARMPSVDRIQIDIVDGTFASPASWPFNVVGEPSTKSDLVLGKMLPYLNRFEYEIDLMCLDAERVAEAWLALGATRLTFHAETATDLPRLLAYVRNRYGMLVSFGLALNIASDLALIEPCLGDVAYIQFMGIARIGKQAEPFDERVFEKVRIFHNRHPEVPLQVDGGISLSNAKKLIACGVSNLVIGSALLHANDSVAEVAKFEALRTPYCV